jgi:hypothetical protein
VPDPHRSDAMGCRQSRSPATRAGPARAWRNPFIPGRTKLRGRRETTPSAKIEAVGRGSSAMPSPKIHIKPIKIHGISLRSTWGPAFRWHTPAPALITPRAGAAPGVSLPAIPLFSKVVSQSMFRNAANENAFENPFMRRSEFWSVSGGDCQKPWYREWPNAARTPQVPIVTDCEHKPRLASTTLRWRAQWQPI